MRSKQTLLGLGLLLAGLFFITTQSVWAHADLKSAKPRPGETVEKAPQIIELTFTQAMQDGDIMLYTIDNEQIATSQQTQDTNTILTANIDDELSVGEYIVFWQATAADGHMLSGSYNFAYQPQTSTPLTERPIFRATAILIFFIVLGAGSWMIYRRRVWASATT